MPPKVVKPTWETLNHFLIELKIVSKDVTHNDEQERKISIKLKPSTSDDSNISKITNFHRLFLRLMSNDEKPPKKAEYKPSYIGSSIFRVSNQWIVGGDLVDGSGKNGNATLDYTEEQLKVTSQILKSQDSLKPGTIILSSRGQFEFGSIFAILLDTETKYLQGDVIVIGQITEGFDELLNALQDFGYIKRNNLNTKEHNDSEYVEEEEEDIQNEINDIQDENTPEFFLNEISTIENGLIVIESCQIISS